MYMMRFPLDEREEAVRRGDQWWPSDRMMRMDRIEDPFHRLFQSVGDRALAVTEPQDPHRKLGNSAVSQGPDKFEMGLNIQHYRPEEIKIKLVDRKLTVEGEHYEESDHGVSHQRFHRSIQLGDNVDVEKLRSELTPRGLLKITAPLIKPTQPQITHQEIPIHRETSNPKMISNGKQ